MNAYIRIFIELNNEMKELDFFVKTVESVL